MTVRNYWKIEVLETLKNGIDTRFIVKKCSIPTKKLACELVDEYSHVGIFARASKHINPKHEYYYGK